MTRRVRLTFAVLQLSSDPATSSTISRLRSAPNSAPSSASTSPSPVTSAPGVAGPFVSQLTFRDHPSSPALASPLSPGLRSAASVSSSAPSLGSSSLLPTSFPSPASMLDAERHHASHSIVRPRPPSADLALSPSLDLSSQVNQSCPSFTDLVSFPPLGSSS